MSDINLKVTLSATDALTPAILKALDSMQTMSEAMTKMAETAKGATGESEGLNTGLLNLSSATNIARAATELAHKAFEFMAEQMSHAWHEALEAEKATTRLTGALVQSGKYTAQLNKDLSEYAESLEKAAGANGEAVKSMIATGLQMGLSVEKAKELEQASRQLAAANGIDVQQAFQALRGSMSGHSRQLAILVPQVKELTASNLRLGGAIDIVSKLTQAQYEAYQNSLPAALEKAKVGFDNIYKALGQILTQSPTVRAVITEIGNLFFNVAEEIEHNQATIRTWVTNGVLFAADALQILNVTLDAVMRVGMLAFNSINGALWTLSLGIKTVIDGPLALLYKALSFLPGEAGKAAKKASDELIKGLADNAAQVNKSAKGVEDAIFSQTTASKKLEDGILHVRDAVVLAEASEKERQKTTEKTLEQQSKVIAANNEVGKSYAGISIGTEKQRLALKGQIEDRNSELKDFKEYLDAKKRLALTKAEEQRIELEKLQAESLKGTAGSTGVTADKSAEVSAEAKKQGELAALREQGVINEQQYDAAILSSQQEQARATLEIAQAQQKAKEDLLGESPEGYALKQQLAEERFQLELQQRLARAGQEDATDAEIAAIRLEAETQRDEEALARKEEHYNKVLARQGVNAEKQDAMRQQWYMKEQAEAQNNMNKILSGMAFVEAAQAASNKVKDKLTDQLIKNQKISAGKMVGIFLESFGRQLIMEGLGNILKGAVLSILLNPQGPALAAAGAAEVATGTAIGRLGASMQGGGGQADEGMDAVPQSLGGKSFILSAGERVVQPEANKALTFFLEKEQRGGSAGGSYNITLYYNGSGSKDDASTMADMVIREIRTRSEKGSPIMSSKGLTK